MAGGTINLAVKTTNDSAGIKAAAADMDSFGTRASGALSKVSAIAGGFILGQGLMQLPGILMSAANAASGKK